MKYDAPKLMALTPAIIAIQGTPKNVDTLEESPNNFIEHSPAYQDWE
jgi:hypothetical protein